MGRLTQLKDEGKKNKSSSECEMENEDEEGQVWGRKSNISLLDQHTELKKLAEGKNDRRRVKIIVMNELVNNYYIELNDFTAKKESAMEKQLKEEEKILESVAERKALMGVGELALGIQYEDPIKTR